MKIGQAILNKDKTSITGNFTKIGIQTPSDFLGDVEVKINDEKILITPLTHIYELEGVLIKSIELVTSNTKIIVDYIGEVSTNG